MNILREIFIDLGIWTFMVIVVGCFVLFIIGIRRMGKWFIRRGAKLRDRWAKEISDHDKILEQEALISRLKIERNDLLARLNILVERNQLLENEKKALCDSIAILDRNSSNLTKLDDHGWQFKNNFTSFVARDFFDLIYKLKQSKGA